MGAEKKPRLHNLKESGDIEQAADSVIFVHPQEDNSRLIIIAKQRVGRLGEVDVYFDEQVMKFCNANSEKVSFNDYTR